MRSQGRGPERGAPAGEPDPGGAVAGGHRVIGVPVAGGELAVGLWGEGGPAVLAVHGITGNHLHWGRVAPLLAGDHLVIAPDLRGRAGSRDLPGPWGMAAHARDLVAVLAHLGVTGAVVVGHSMGGFVATALVALAPEVVRAVVLVDGGVPLPGAPRDLPVDEAVEAVIGPARRRLDMRFADRDAYRAFWAAHPALSGCFDEVVTAAVDRDLTGEPPEMVPGVRLEAVTGDARDLLVDDTPERNLGALARAGTPGVLLWATAGMLGDPPGLYPPDAIAALGPGLPVDAVRVDGVNHYTVVLGPTGAAAVADHVRRFTR